LLSTQSDSILRFCDKFKVDGTDRILGNDISKFRNFEISKLLSTDDEEHVSASNDELVDED